MTAIRSLKQRISREAIDVEYGSTNKTEKWISWASIRSIITETAGDVVGELTTDKRLAKSLKTFALSKARRLLALLVYTKCEEWFELFYRNDFGDEMFPIEIVGKGSQRAVESTKTGKRADFLEEQLGDCEIESICDMWQWMFFVPVFSPNDKTASVFHWRCRLPFIKEYNTYDSNFSSVTHLVMHRDHLKFEHDDQIGAVLDSNGNPHVAVKKLLARGTPEKFQKVVENEASVLGRFQDHNHPHFIRAIARYTQENHHYFIFPWAKGGNLREFWKNQPSLSSASPNFSSHDWDVYIRWFFDQLVGLADAIEKLHYPANQYGVSCRHGDLKPENILCFGLLNSGPGKIPKGAKLVIADAGHAKVHEKVTELRHDTTNTPTGTNTYKPPEVVYLSKDARSRRYDIWSLGCLYLEFLIWILYDNEGLRKFRRDIGVNEPLFREHPEMAVKDMVRKWIQYIKEDPRCSSAGPTALRRFVELIESRLLVVKIIIRHDSKSEFEATDYSKEHAESSYAEGSVPWPLVTRPTFEIDANETERADAREMLKEMRKIREAANGASLPWINWDGIAKPRSPWPTASLDTRSRAGSLRGSDSLMPQARV
ncbi:protein kinase domain-containing protein [Colletotrichum graminicola]|uniref:Protein kinase domain-containing protein n=1 Tax=Colletotrichum graminicola (strain M1.001 / M2 / FGSC 10212) TaxID=645133 RepID=E3Q3X1_COLGM|nr:protein kinase domain-containing protein [Colletotrichum graminicola M1.001]EFQ25723.1 protein kinase domain-containing protein [Colletotrichum graminicola M1.001]WDK10925.1 protein kinase domain-containing protein [Colletotrichum graminicola]